MSTVSIREAQQSFTDLIHAAEHGETVEITRDGKTVAKIVPNANKKSKGMPNLKAFRDSIQMTDKPLSSVIDKIREEERY